MSRRVLYVNVTATLGVNVPPNASPDDVRSALDVTNLSADDPIAMLAANPDRFFGRTTKVSPLLALCHSKSTKGRYCVHASPCCNEREFQCHSEGLYSCLVAFWAHIAPKVSRGCRLTLIICLAADPCRPAAAIAASVSAVIFYSVLQALDVTAETDGRSPQRTEYRPFGSGSALGQAWPAIGAVLLLLIILGGCLIWHWRRRSRRLQRICDAILERCRSCRRGSSRYPSSVRPAASATGPSSCLTRQTLRSSFT